MVLRNLLVGVGQFLTGMAWVGTWVQRRENEPLFVAGNLTITRNRGKVCL